MASYKGRPATIGTFRNITEDRKQEDAIRESEQKYRTLVEINRDIIFSLDTDGTIRYVSPQTEPLLGYRPDEMEGNVFTLFIHPDDSGLLVRHIQDSLATGEPPRRDQFRIRRKDGTYRWFEDNTRYTTDGRGRPVLAGTIRDIADEKAAQDALRESEEKYRTLVETTSDFIWEVDADGKYTYVSPQVSRILGYEPGELIGKTPFDLMPPDEAERISAEFSHLAHSRLPISGLENKIIRKDGSVVILETSGVVRSSVDGGFLGYHGIDRDITDRKLAEEALREKTEEFNRFFTASLDLFCIADTEGYFRRLNPEWEKTLGYTLDELEGHRFLDFVHPDDLASTLSAVADLKEQKNVINFTNRYRHKDGTYRWIEWRSLPIGSLIFAAARDITARHDAAERTARISALKQDLLRTAPLEEKLKRITDTFVDIFGADFARIWISGPGDLCSLGCIHAGVKKGPHICRDRSRCLHLIVSSGRYSHTDGSHRRVPFGAYNIGRIATGQESYFITNDVTHDPRVHDHSWAASLGLVSFAGFRLVSAEGSPIGVLAFFSRLPIHQEIMEDLTDIATTASQVIQTGMAEDALREGEARLASILHGSPVLQFVIDQNHKVISWNKALEEYSGIRAADIIGTDQQWRAFYKKRRPVLADLLVDGEVDALDTWYSGKVRDSRYVEGAFEATDFFPYMGGSGKWLSFTAAPVRDVRGTIIGAVETLEDVTERIDAENALRQSEEWARTILNTAQTGILIIDTATHRILEANKKALDLIGLPAESVIGSVCHRFICPAEEGKCPVTDCRQEVDTSERILITADGTRLPVLKTVVQVTMGNREVLVESFVDITDQKRSESAIREVNRKLNLLSSITRHDVANQLTVVHGYTQLAAMKKPDPVVKDFLGKIETSVETIQRQIEFTKQYQELGVHAPGWFNAGEVIRGARPKNVRLRCSCDEYEVFADPMIGRVFYNLFDNAMKYGGHVTTITAGCKKHGDELVITFADNGVGIPPDEKKKIFEKGFGKHTGFGLFLAREILAITGITIHETGVEGRGARFEIVVPKGAFRQ
jgi:PAS domain S-box-containing protein